jgi:hypothetical protein
MAASYSVLQKNGDQLAQAVVDLTAALASHATQAAIALGIDHSDEVLREAFPELDHASDAVKVWKAGVS